MKNVRMSCSVSGVYNALVGNKDGLLVMHCPKGCSYINMAMQLASEYRSIDGKLLRTSIHSNVYVSGMEEHDAVFGGEDKLRRCIEKAITHSSAKYIVVANSCVGGVIGDDVAAIAEEMEKKYAVPVIDVPYSGFLNGDYYDGFVSTAKNMVDKLMHPQNTMANTATIIGTRSMGMSDEPSMEGLVYLLKAFGIKVNTMFPTHTSFIDIQRLPMSSMTLVCGGSQYSFSLLREIGLHIKSKFGIPFFDRDYPAGWPDLVRWINSLGLFLNKTEFVEQIIANEKQKLENITAKHYQHCSGVRAAVGIGRSLIYFDPEWVVDLLQRVGIQVEQFFLYEELKSDEAAVMRRHLNRMMPQAEVVSGIDAGQLQYYLNDVELVLSTHKLSYGLNTSWLLIPFAPGAGVEGMEDFLNMVVGKL